MPRPSKLSADQWALIEGRHLNGESIRGLAREYKISESAIRQQISSQCEEIKTVAQQILRTEENFHALPVSAQINTLKHVERVKTISENLSSAGGNGALIASRLSGIAVQQIGKIDPLGTLEKNGETLQSVMALTKTANNAAVIGLNLLRANKEMIEEMNSDNIRNMSDEELNLRLEELLQGLP
jgi:hypothetical protein